MKNCQILFLSIVAAYRKTITVTDEYQTPGTDCSDSGEGQLYCKMSGEGHCTTWTNDYDYDDDLERKTCQICEEGVINYVKPGRKEF